MVGKKDIFYRYSVCNKMIKEMPGGKNKEHAEAILSQLLHIEQARVVAYSNYKKYCKEMNDWENNLVANISRIVKESKERI